MPLPSINLDGVHLDKAVAAGTPILTFEQVPIDWSDLRFLVRSTSDAMRTHEAIEAEDYRRVEARLTRDADGLAPAARSLRGHVEARFEIRRLRVCNKPGLGRLPQSAHLLGRDHLQRIALLRAALRLDLAEDDCAPAAQHEVELVAADPEVRR